MPRPPPSPPLQPGEWGGEVGSPRLPHLPRARAHTYLLRIGRAPCSDAGGRRTVPPCAHTASRSRTQQPGARQSRYAPGALASSYAARAPNPAGGLRGVRARALESSLRHQFACHAPGARYDLQLRLAGVSRCSGRLRDFDLRRAPICSPSPIFCQCKCLGLEATWEEFTYCTPHRVIKERRKPWRVLLLCVRNAPLESIENGGVGIRRGCNGPGCEHKSLASRALVKCRSVLFLCPWRPGVEVCPTKLLLPGRNGEALRRGS